MGIVQAARATSENLDKAKLAAHDVASSRNAHEAGSKVWTLWRHAERGSFVTALARMLVSFLPPAMHLLQFWCGNGYDCTPPPCWSVPSKDREVLT